MHARRRLSIALLAMMPLFVIYEASRAAVAAEGHNWRNTAEVLFSEPIELLGGGAEWRWLLLAIVAVAALVRAWKLGVNWGEGVLWSMLEGGAIGILLGPLMMLLLGGVFGWLPEAQLGASAASVAPPISRGTGVVRRRLGRVVVSLCSAGCGLPAGSLAVFLSRS